MKIKISSDSVIKTPKEGEGIFYIDKESKKLKLKKLDKTIFWKLKKLSD
jgi:hypothetical protein